VVARLTMKMFTMSATSVHLIWPSSHFKLDKKNNINIEHLRNPDSILEIGFPSFFYEYIQYTFFVVNNNFQPTGIKPKSW